MRIKYLEPAIEISSSIKEILPYFEEVEILIQNLKDSFGQENAYRARAFLNLRSALYNEIIVPVRKLERKMQSYKNDVEMEFEQIIKDFLNIIDSDSISLEDVLKLERYTITLQKELKKLA